MLSSDFIEKGKETIELKEFKADKINIFMDAIFRTKEFEVNHDSINILLELFVYFGATHFLINLFKQKKVFDTIQADELLKLSERFGVEELKIFVEESLSVEMRQKFANKPYVPKKKQFARDFKIEELAFEGLILADEYKLKKLQENIDAQLAVDYFKSAHFLTAEDEYMKLLEKYRLVELTKAIEKYAVRIFDRDPKTVMKKYLTSEKKVEMTEFKKHAENYMLGEFDKTYTRHSGTEYLYDCQKYGFMELKEKIRSYLEANYEEIPGEDGEYSRERFNLQTLAYDLEPFKSRQEKIMVDEFKKNKENYKKFIRDIANFNLPVLKDAIEQYLLNNFNNLKKKDALIEELCKYSRDCKMEKLKDSLESYFLDEFHSNHCLKYIKYAFQCDMQKFKDVVSDFLSTRKYDDLLLKAGREFLLKLPAEHHHFVLGSILRKPDSPNSRGIFY